MQSTPLSVRSILAAPNLDVEDLEERIDIIAHKLKFIADDSKPRVLFLADVSPVQSVTNPYLDILTRGAGGIPIGTTADGTTADVIVVVSNKTTPQLLSALPTLFSTPGWSESVAVKNGSIYLIHHPDYLRQPGALIADDMEILAEILHPKQFVFGRDKDVWMKFEG